MRSTSSSHPTQSQNLRDVRRDIFQVACHHKWRARGRALSGLGCVSGRRAVDVERGSRVDALRFPLQRQTGRLIRIKDPIVAVLLEKRKQVLSFPYLDPNLRRPSTPTLTPYPPTSPLPPKIDPALLVRRRVVRVGAEGVLPAVHHVHESILSKERAAEAAHGE